MYFFFFVLFNIEICVKTHLNETIKLIQSTSLTISFIHRTTQTYIQYCYSVAITLQSNQL